MTNQPQEAVSPPKIRGHCRVGSAEKGRHSLPGSLVTHGKMPPLPAADEDDLEADVGAAFGAAFGAGFLAIMTAEERGTTLLAASAGVTRALELH